MSNPIIFVVVLIIIVAAVIVTIVAIASSISQPGYRYKPSAPSAPSSSSIRQQLYRMIQDRDAVDRLIALTRKNYPGQSEQWILEKTLAQLERDRRY